MVSEEHLLSHLTKTFDNYKSYRKKNQEQRMIDNIRLYKSYRKNKAHIWQSNIFLSYAFTMIETIMPRIVSYLWQGDKFVSANPRGREDEIDAKVVDSLMQYQISTQIENFFLEFVEFAKTYLIQGTGIAMMPWDVANDKPTFINKDLFDVYVQPFKKHLDQMDGLFDVYDIPYDVLLERQMGGVKYNNLEKIKGTSIMTKDEQGNRERDQEVGKIQNYDPSRPLCLIYRYWGKIPVQESIDVGTGYSATRYQEALVEIGNRKQIIRNDPNPYVVPGLLPDGLRPFVVATNYTDPGEFYGIGDIEPYKDVQMEANENENQIIDNIRLITNRMWKVSKTAGIDLSNLMSYPGNIVQADDINSIEPLVQQEIPQSSFKQQDRYPSLIQQISGVSDYTQGKNAEGMTDTVGGISALIEENNMRFAFKLKVLQMSAIKDFATKQFMLSKIFIKGIEIPVRLEGDIGREWVTIAPDNLKGMYDFVPTSVSMIGNKLAKENTYIRLLDVLKGAPPVPALVQSILEQFELPNREEVMTQMYQLWGIPDPNAPIPPPIMAGQEVGGGSGVSPSQPLPLPPPAMINNAGAARSNSMQMAAGMR